MSDYLECAVRNGLRDLGRIENRLSEAFNTDFSRTTQFPRCLQFLGREKFDVSITPTAALYSHFRHWWFFAAEPEVRRDLFRESLNFAKLFRANEILFFSSSAEVSSHILSGWGIQHIRGYLLDRFGEPLTDFSQFEVPDFGETRDDSIRLSRAYFRFSVEDVAGFVNGV